MIEQNILSELASFTEAGEHTKFELLQNWQEYKLTRKTRFAIKVLTGSLRQLTNKQFKTYCKSVTSGVSDVYQLLAYSSLVKILNFYSDELKVVEEMIYEYEAYLMEGNLIDSFFGEQRPVDKLWDHRGL
jgi:uncharacterized protein YgbK (DUF1537 family)